MLNQFFHFLSQIQRIKKWNQLSWAQDPAILEDDFDSI